jgi:phosphomannomutase
MESQYCKSKTMLLFDIDGTLTMPRQTISPDMKSFLKEWSKKIPLSIVSGSNLEKIYEQLGDCLDLFEYVFSENGTVVHYKGELVQVCSMSEYLGEHVVDDLVAFGLSYMKDLDLPLKTTQFVEVRNGMLNFAPIGRSCSKKQRDEFEEYDKEKLIRAKLITSIYNHFPDIPIRCSKGGQISIDVFPQGWDKTFCLSHLKEYQKIIFFGDKGYVGGNDYEIFKDDRVEAHHVLNPQDTMKQVQNLQ